MLRIGGRLRRRFARRHAAYPFPAGAPREDDRAILLTARAAKADDYPLAFRPDRVEPVDANVTTSEVEAA